MISLSEHGFPDSLIQSDRVALPNVDGAFNDCEQSTRTEKWCGRGMVSEKRSLVLELRLIAIQIGWTLRYTIIILPKYCLLNKKYLANPVLKYKNVAFSLNWRRLRVVPHSFNSPSCQTRKKTTTSPGVEKRASHPRISHGHFFSFASHTTD